MLTIHNRLSEGGYAFSARIGGLEEVLLNIKYSSTCHYSIHSALFHFYHLFGNICHTDVSVLTRMRQNARSVRASHFTYAGVMEQVNIVIGFAYD
jgi:hypothetical protein